MIFSSLTNLHKTYTFELWHRESDESYGGPTLITNILIRNVSNSKLGDAFLKTFAKDRLCAVCLMLKHFCFVTVFFYEVILLPLFAIIWFLSVATCIYMALVEDIPGHTEKWIALFAIATSKMMWSDIKRSLALRKSGKTDSSKRPI